MDLDLTIDVHLPHKRQPEGQSFLHAQSEPGAFVSCCFSSLNADQGSRTSRWWAQSPESKRLWPQLADRKASRPNKKQAIPDQSLWYRTKAKVLALLCSGRLVSTLNGSTPDGIEVQDPRTQFGPMLSWAKEGPKRTKASYPVYDPCSSD